MWEGWEPDVSTLVNIDGTIAGFTKGGHFISAAACSPVVQELMAHGSSGGRSWEFWWNRWDRMIRPGRAMRTSGPRRR